MFIALTGTIGSGKDTVAKYLVEHHGFHFASGSDLIAGEVRKRGLAASRENMRSVANELRKRDGTRLLDMMINEAAGKRDVVIGFLRTENAIRRLREVEPAAILAGVDAPIDTRYKRAAARNEEKDRMTLDEFVAAEALEMSSEDPDTQNIGYCMSHADIIVMNDSSLEDLHNKIEEMLVKITRTSQERMLE